jgi:hypothetical protein
MTGSYAKVLRRGLGKVFRSSPRVLWVRSLQEARVAWLRYTNGWDRLAHRVDRWWTDDRVEEYLSSPLRGPIAAEGAATMTNAADAGRVDAHALLDLARRVRSRDLVISGRPLPTEGPWPWTTDWRYGHQWPVGDFRDYDHYLPRDEPYDVRAVWELARLWFLLPVVQAAALEPDAGWADLAEEVVVGFQGSNPIARTINWHPMEVSMRAVSLALMLGMAHAMQPQPRSLVGRLLPMLTAHSEFLYRTVEYGNLRHNHFMANIAALAVVGSLLGSCYPSAQGWLEYGRRHLIAEIPDQILPDGVSFEKSTSYHRMVTELLVLAAVALDRSGQRLPEAPLGRVRRAVSFVAHTIRADGLSPNLGDNDGARVLAFETFDQRDHRPLVAAGAALFADPHMKAVARTGGYDPSPSILWLLGAPGLAEWDSLSGDASADAAQHFAEGGVITVRRGGSSLCMDVGEVGLRGRGGHGHNDLLSFELVLDGQPLVVDPGSPVYTGDPALLDRYRATGAHNGLMVDGLEMAPMGRLWVIADTARPVDAGLDESDGEWTARAGHTGYQRLPDPVTHYREIRLIPGEGVAEVTDQLECEGTHSVERFLQLPPGAEVGIDGQRVRVAVSGLNVELRADEASRVSVGEAAVSRSFGEEEAAPKVILSTKIQGRSSLHYRLGRVGEPPA